MSHFESAQDLKEELSGLLPLKKHACGDATGKAEETYLKVPEIDLNKIVPVATNGAKIEQSQIKEMFQF